jgi:hypothetical protein
VGCVTVGVPVPGADGVTPPGVVGVVPPGPVTSGPPPGWPCVVGSVGATGLAPGARLGPVVGLTPDAEGSTAVVVGAAETGWTTTSSWAPGPDARGTIAESVLASTIVMSSPKPMPTAV